MMFLDHDTWELLLTIWVWSVVPPFCYLFIRRLQDLHREGVDLANDDNAQIAFANDILKYILFPPFYAAKRIWHDVACWVVYGQDDRE